jgi:hypothetical protein
MAARPALAFYAETYQLNPSFKMGAAFGLERKEKTDEGHVIIRKGSSEFFSEEKFEERFFRILERHNHADIKFLLNHLSKEKPVLIRAVLRGNKISELIEILEGRLCVVNKKTDDSFERNGLMASCSMAGGRMEVFTGGVVETHLDAISALDEMLTRFKMDFFGS